MSTINKTRISKRNNLWGILIFLGLLFPISLFADGGLFIHKFGYWYLFGEERQYCAINYKNHIQNMILTINTTEKLSGEKAVWIFPIPALPQETKIDIQNDFNQFSGYDFDSLVEYGEIINKPLLTLDLPMLILSCVIGPKIHYLFIHSGCKINSADSGITIHKTIAKLGLTTQLITANNSMSIDKYLSANGLKFPDQFSKILDQYIGKKYSFVVSWISDKKDFKSQKIYDSMEDIDNDLNKVPISVTLSFPTEKIYYPLIPTSIYGNITIPVHIYIMDYVKPELYSKIEKNTKVTYYRKKKFEIPPKFKSFFFGKDKFEPLRYTQIDIKCPAVNFTNDLWIKNITGISKLKLEIKELIFKAYFRLFIIVIFSCLSCWIAGRIVFKKNKVRYTHFLLVGLLNVLSIGIFIIFIFCWNKLEEEKFRKKLFFVLIFIVTYLSEFIDLEYLLR